VILRRYESRTWYEGIGGGGKARRHFTRSGALEHFRIGCRMHRDAIRQANFWCPNPEERRRVDTLARSYRCQVRDRKTGETTFYEFNF
jgi:hypothetical protein